MVLRSQPEPPNPLGGADAPTVAVRRSALAAMIAASNDAAPQESCGLLLGDARTIEHATPVANVAAEPLFRFEIDPGALIAAHRAERAGGMALVGYFHSHPVGHPRPSATDCEHASGDGRLWAIVANDETTLWRDTPQGFASLSYDVIDG